MAKNNYQANVGKESNTARAMLTNAPVSLKYSVEVCNQIKTMPVNKAIAFMKRIYAHEDYLPLRVYNKKVAQEFIKLFELVKANADNKGLDAEKLLIIHIYANAGINRFSYQSKGRIAGKARRRNATNIEVIVQEMKN